MEHKLIFNETAGDISNHTNYISLESLPATGCLLLVGDIVVFSYMLKKKSLFFLDISESNSPRSSFNEKNGHVSCFLFRIIITRLLMGGAFSFVGNIAYLGIVERGGVLIICLKHNFINNIMTCCFFKLNISPHFHKNVAVKKKCLL